MIQKDIKPREIGIVGAGITGLALAYRLARRGDKVTVIEAGKDIGGLMGGFQINGNNLEKAYHHIFRTDKDIINLAKELKIEEKILWKESSIGLFYGNKLYPFMGAFDLLKFSPLGLIDKFRLGVVKIYLEKNNNWEQFIRIPAYKWMRQWCGENAYKVIWEPLLKGKFHDYYNKVSMAWLWARIHTRANSKEKGETKEKLGYFEGGFNIISEKLREEIEKREGKVLTESPVSKISKGENNRILVTVGKKTMAFDKVVGCVPSHVFSKMVTPKGRREKEYFRKLQTIDYLGAVVVVFTSKQSLSKYYWHNINDTSSPFLAFIQHTNLITKDNYQNEEVYYMGTYVPNDHRFFSMEDKEVSSEFFDYLNKIFPEFKKKIVKKTFTFKLKNAQHIVTCDYDKKIPEYETPVRNLYLSNFSQIFPEDRGTNFSVREANRLYEILSR